MLNSQQAVTGDLSAFSVLELTQTLSMARRSGVIFLMSGSREGQLHFLDGQIVAAFDPDLRGGNRAAVELFSWDEGMFEIAFDRKPSEPNVTASTDHLMMEFARNVDETKRDRAEKHSSGEGNSQSLRSEVSERVDDDLQSRVNAIFKRVANDSVPHRARHSLDAFDALLSAAIELQGTVLFLRPDHRPSVRTRSGFASIKDTAIEREELVGFLKALLTEAEWLKLREQKELVTYFHSNAAGPFKVVAIEEQGGLLLTFSPSGKSVPPLKLICDNPNLLDCLTSMRDGLILIAGPIGVGKELLLDAAVKHHLLERDSFAYQFSKSSAYSITADRGFCVRRSLPTTGHQLQDAVRAALDQGPDVITFSGGSDREAFTTALGSCGLRRLILFTLESHSPSDTLNRLFHMARTTFGDSLLDSVAEHLRAIIDLAPATRNSPAASSALIVDQEIQDVIRKGDVNDLRRLSLIRAPEPVPQQ